MKYIYFVSPLLAWIVSGSVKFMINSIKLRKLTFCQIGYGGFPSTHAAIVTNMTVLISLKEGIATPIFGLAFTLMMLTIIDAMGLRRHIGKQAKAINQLTQPHATLKERMGHEGHEITAGMLVGAAVAYLLCCFF